MNSSLGALCAKHNLVSSLTFDQLVRFAAFFVKCSKQDGEAPFQEARWESFSQELSENVGVHLSSDACKNLVDILKSSCPSALSYFHSPLREVEVMHLNIVQLSDETVTCFLSYLHLPELACVTGVAKSWNSRFRSVLSHKPFVNLCARQGFTHDYRPLCWNFLLKVYKQPASTTSQFLSFQTEESTSKRTSNSNASLSSNSDFTSARELEISTTSSQEKTILNDVVRTLPEEDFLHSKRSEKMIFDLINTYVLSDPEVGYCQPMSLLAAVVVAVIEQASPLKNELGEVVPRSLLASTEKAFALYSALMRGRDLRSMFKLHLPLLSLCLFQLDALIRKCLPQIHSHFEKQQIESFSYATEWYLTMFAGVLPVSVVQRLWDLFLCDGWLVFHQFVLNFLVMQQDVLLASVGFDCIRQMQKALTKLGTQLSDLHEIQAANACGQQHLQEADSSVNSVNGTTPVTGTSSFTPTTSSPSPPSPSDSFDPTSRSAFTPIDGSEDFKSRNSDIFFEPLSLTCSSSTSSSLYSPTSAAGISASSFFPVLHTSTHRFINSRDVNSRKSSRRSSELDLDNLPNSLTLSSQVPAFTSFTSSSNSSLPTRSLSSTPTPTQSSPTEKPMPALFHLPPTASLPYTIQPTTQQTTSSTPATSSSSSSADSILSTNSSFSSSDTDTSPLSSLTTSSSSSSSSITVSAFSSHPASSSSMSPSISFYSCSPVPTIVFSSASSTSASSSATISTTTVSNSLSPDSTNTKPASFSSSPLNVGFPPVSVPPLSSCSAAVRETWSTLLNDSFGLTKQLMAQLESDYSLVVARRQQKSQEGVETPRPEPVQTEEQPAEGEAVGAHLWGFQKLDTNFFSPASRSNSVPSPPPDPATHVAVAREGMNMLLKAVASSRLKKDWEFLEQKDNVHIWRRRHVDSPEAKMDVSSSISCKGVGIIARATPLDLLNLLQESVLTGRYASFDEMCASCTVVECLSKSTYVIHKTFRLWRWCQAASRDFCAVSQIRSLPDGTCVWVARSVKHPKCPSVKGTIRSTVNFEGWVFKPIYANTQQVCPHVSRTGLSTLRPVDEGSEKANRRCAQCPPPKVIGTEATYVIDIELLASVPAMFINKINLQRPLLINDLAVFFNTRPPRRTDTATSSPTQLRSPTVSATKPTSKPSSLTKLFSRQD